MKGVVFTHLSEMVEQEFGLEVLDKIITQSDLASGGVYTAVGTYDYKEAFQLVIALEKEVGIPADSLLMEFGKYLFKQFSQKYT